MVTTHATRLGASALVVVAVSGYLLATVSPFALTAQNTAPGQATKTPPPVGDSSCDVDGVKVAYTPAYKLTPAPPAYRVAQVSLTDVSPSCATAALTITLRNGTTVLGSAGVVVGGTGAAVVPFATAPPAASAVTGVDVKLDGGSLPIPADCQAMTFDSVFTGTPGNDVLIGTNQRDVVFTEQGSDTVNTLNGTDCVVGVRGPAQVTVGAQSSVVTFASGTPAGFVTVAAGNGDNLVRLPDGGGSVTVGNGTNVLRGGAGNDVFSVGSGVNNVDGGGGVNTCHVPAASVKKNTVLRCTVVSP